MSLLVLNDDSLSSEQASPLLPVRLLPPGTQSRPCSFSGTLPRVPKAWWATTSTAAWSEPRSGSPVTTNPSNTPGQWTKHWSDVNILNLKLNQTRNRVMSCFLSCLLPTYLPIIYNCVCVCVCQVCGPRSDPGWDLRVPRPGRQRLRPQWRVSGVVSHRCGAGARWEQQHVC